MKLIQHLLIISPLLILLCFPVYAEPASGESSCVSSLEYNEAVSIDDTLYVGSQQWLTYTEALAYHPALPLPQTYQNCPIVACSVDLSTAGLDNITPNEVVTVPISPQNVSSVVALYSDGITNYRILFGVGTLHDSYEREKVSENGFLLLSTENEPAIVVGAELKQDNAYLQVLDGKAADPYEVKDGIIAYATDYVTSQYTKDNAAYYLENTELTTLFDSLMAFVAP